MFLLKDIIIRFNIEMNKNIKRKEIEIFSNNS